MTTRLRLRLIVVSVVIIGLVTMLMIRCVPGPGQVTDSAPSGTSQDRPRWLSGVNGDPTPTAANVDAFAAWRGVPADVAVVYTNRISWAGIVDTDWLYSNFRRWPGRLVISQPPYPEGQGNLVACARGTYDEHWRDFGRTLIRQRRANSIVRVGWEANGNFMYWSATNTAAYKSCFRRVASAIKNANSKVVIEWTINGHGSQSCEGNAINCYPGDDVVDIIGIDNYDQYPPVYDQRGFDDVANRPDGLEYLYQFAIQRHKRFAVGEWGVTTRNEQGGGDNPFFVNAMFDWFAAHSDNLEYEAYFNQCGTSDVQSDLFRCGPINPKSAAVYRDRIRQR